MKYAILHAVSKQVLAICASYQEAVEYVNGSNLYIIKEV